MAQLFDQIGRQVGRLLEDVERGLREIIDQTADALAAPLPHEQREYLGAACAAAQAALERLGGLAGAAPGAGQVPPSQVLSVDEVWLRVDGDRELLSILVGIYRDDSVRLLQLVSSTIDAGDGEGLRRAAHSLRGATSNFAPRTTCTTAQELEDLARDRDFTRARRVHQRLVSEVGELMTALGQLIASGPP